MNLNNIFTNKNKIEIIGNGNRIQFAQYSKIGNLNIYIFGDNNTIEIGEHCQIKKISLWIEDNYCVIKIGDFCTVESAHFAATENNSTIKLGNDCMLSYDVEIRTGDSHSIIDTQTNSRINIAKSVYIGNHVWIGAKSTILKGVDINDNVVIGTGAIVTSNCPKNSLLAGVPAKIIKQDITWKRERI